MKILAFDTSVGACSAAVAHLEDGALVDLFATFEVMNKGHAEQLLPMIKAMLDKSGLGFADLDRIAVTAGPGTFTGVRIGVATARGLALASKKPVVSTTSLHVIALGWLRQVADSSQQQFSADDSEIIVVLDARRGDVYLQCFSSKGLPLDDVQILSVRDVAGYLKKRGGCAQHLMIGSGAGLLQADALGSEFWKDSLFLPDARDLSVIAEKLPVSEGKISPLYLRAADAKTQSGKAIARK